MPNDHPSADRDDLLAGLPDSEPDLLDRIHRLRANGELEAALDLVDRALEQSASPGLRKTRARLSLDSGAPEEARESVRPLCAAAQPDPEALVLTARASIHIGDLDVARTALTHAEQLDPEPALLDEVREELEEAERGAPGPGDTDTTDVDLEATAETERDPPETDASAGPPLPDDTAEQSLFEESRGVEADEENPFEADDTVLDEGIAETVEETAQPAPEATDDISPPAPPDGDDDQTVDVPLSEAADDRDAETFPEPDDTDVDLRSEGRITGDTADDTFQVSTEPGTTVEEVDDLLVEGDADPETRNERPDFQEIDTEPVGDYAEGREDIQIADAEPTQLIELGTSETDGANADEETVDIPLGTTEAEETTGPLEAPASEAEGSEPTIEVDEELRQEAISAAEGEAPTDEIEAAEPPTDPRASGAEGRFPAPDGSEAATDPEVPTGPPPGAGRSADEESSNPNTRRESPSARSSAPRPSSPAEAPATGPDRAARPGPNDGTAGGDRHSTGREPRPDRRERRHPSRREPAPNSPPASASAETNRREKTGRDRPLGRRVRAFLPLPDWINCRVLLFAASVTALSLGLLLVAAAAVTNQLDASALQAALDETRSRRAPDTYRAWKQSLAKARSTLQPAPGAFRRGLRAIGSIVPGADPKRLRSRLEREHAFIAAILEARFEAPGRRDAAKLVEALAGAETSPVLAAARVYLSVARARYARSLRRARDARQAHPDSRRVADALLYALLEADDRDEAVSLADTIRDGRRDLSVFTRYLAVRAALHDADRDVEPTVASLLETYSPDHLDAKITRLRALARGGKLDRAISQGDRLLDRYGDAAAPSQLARLHVAVGDAQMTADETARAEEHYRTAAEAQPNRPEFRLPLVDLLVTQGRLERAANELQALDARSPAPPPVRRRLARVRYLRGAPADALDALSEDQNGSEIEAPILRGRILLALGDYERCRTVLNALSSSHPRYPTAQALELVAQTRMGVADRQTALELVETLESDHPDTPEILRAAARVRLHFARTLDDDRRRRLIGAARESLERAAAKPPDRAATDYLLCASYLAEREREAALEACQRARETNPEFLYGAVVSARTRLLEGELTGAEKLLSSATDALPDRWDVAALRIRTALRNRSPDRARKILDRWLGRGTVADAELKLYEGLVEFTRANYPTALGYFEKARNVERNRKEATLYLAHTLARLGELDRAERLVDGLTASEHWDGPAWLVFGELRRRQGRERDALENLDIAEEHFQSDFAPPWRIAHLYAERALAWRDLRGWDDSGVLENLREGKARGDTESPEIQFAYGLYFHVGPGDDANRAATHFEKVVDLQPHRCRALGALLEVYDPGDGRRERIADLHRSNCES